MGRRSGTETAFAILRAFVERRLWRQADLARRLEITVPSLRKHLATMATLHPLTMRKDHPDVFWELPRDWSPSGVTLDRSDVAAIMRLLARGPKTQERERLLALLLRKQPTAPRSENVVATTVDEEEGRFLPVVEDAAAAMVTLRMKYTSARRGETDWRDASVARIYPGPPARFLATCHRNSELRMFRVSSIANACLALEEPFQRAQPSDVERRERDSVDGWFDDNPGTISFFVSSPHDRWVRRNLKPGMRVEAVDGGARVTAAAAGLVAVARFVVSLGEAAEAETESLAIVVRDLALGALKVPSPKALSARSVVRIRAKR